MKALTSFLTSIFYARWNKMKYLTHSLLYEVGCLGRYKRIYHFMLQSWY